MENAAKALIIAGGILIAIMTLSVLVYASTSRTRIAQAQVEKKAAEELAKFNREYESYNKDRLYGVDVITVMNKAIEHNTRMQAADMANPYYINIVFSTNEDFTNEIYMSVLDVGTKEKIREEYGIRTNIPTRWSGVDLTTNIITNGIQYNLGTFNGGAFIFNDIVRNIFTAGYVDDDTFSTNDPINNTITTYTLYSALTNFKRAIFTCTDVEYNNGRIRSMTFEQVNTNEDLYL